MSGEVETLGGSKSASWSAVREQEDMVHGNVETSERFESAGWSAMREIFGGVCCVCVSVWSVPAWELDSRGHGYDLVGVWVCGLYPRGNWTHVATGTAWLV